MPETQFVQAIAKILGDEFFLSDMIWQEELTVMQDDLATLIARQANAGNRLAMRMADCCPITFTKQ